MRKFGLMVAAGAMAALAGCGGGGTLHSRDSSGGGPDEFAVMPMRELVIPASLTLPQPTPGAGNLADPNPRADGLAAMGGVAGAGVPGDGALMAHVQRSGVETGIRATLAAEDAAIRANPSGGGLFGGGERYFPTYARMALDARSELARFRAAGVATPSAPPG